MERREKMFKKKKKKALKEQEKDKARKRESGSFRRGRWSSLPTCLVAKFQATGHRNPTGNSQLITAVTAENNTSSSHNARGVIQPPWVVLQRDPFMRT